MTTAGVGTTGCVLQLTCVTGELERNFIIMHTSSGVDVNIMGVCGGIGIVACGWELVVGIGLVAVVEMEIEVYWSFVVV